MDPPFPTRLWCHKLSSFLWLGEFPTDLPALLELKYFLSSFDTIANVLGETIYLLALHPEIQEKLYAEVEETMNSGNGDISYEAANKLEYLEMVISGEEGSNLVQNNK